MRKTIYEAIGGQALLFGAIGVLALMALLFLDQIYDLTPREIVVEAHGMLFDILLFGIILAVYDRITKHREDVQRYVEEIEDFRGWEGKEAMYRIVGNIRRLNRLGVSKLSLRDANLAAANLIEVNLEEAELMRANLQGARLGAANLQKISGLRANMEGVYAKATDFSGANLQDANLQGAELIQANLGNTILQGANLLGAHLMEADLRGANLSGADMRGTDLKGAKVYSNQIRTIKEAGGDVGQVIVEA